MGSRILKRAEDVHDLAHRRLRISMAAGALYDLTFAVVNLGFPQVGSMFLEIPLPEQQVYLRMTGVFLLVLGLFYMLPVIHPGHYLGNVVVAILARTAGAIFLCAAALWFGQPVAFLALGVVDLVFAVIHLLFLWQATGGHPLRPYLG
ncbi:MAG: hypothetical protein ACREAA_12185 [Candidatus Polarisedimenticolia bacterium]